MQILFKSNLLKKPQKVLLLIIFFSFLVFTRFYNLENTARFIWDESIDLVRMHQIYVEKKLTFIGHISEDNSKVFSSLTYYMLLPFAILGNFDPVSPAWGTAFWGTVTAVLVIFLTKIINPSLLPYTFILVLVWYPLVESSRSAWNPYLIPFWSTLGIILYLKQTRLNLFLSGFILGLTIHLHYLSLFALGGFITALIIKSFQKHQLEKPFLVCLGIGLAILPFIIFDLRHPPGLFLSRFLYFNHSEASGSLGEIFDKATTWFQYMTFYYTQSQILSVVLGIFIFILLIFEIQSKSPTLLLSIPWLTQVVGLIFVFNPGPMYYYYLLPSTIFFLVWVLTPRTGLTKKIASIILGILIIGGLLSIIPKLTNKTWQTDNQSLKSMVKIIENKIKTEGLKNSNLVVLASPDNNTYGRRYRDLLLINDVKLKSRDEYAISDHLFVISTGTENQIRSDPAFEMHFFRKGPLRDKWEIKGSSWVIYHFTKPPN